MRSRAWPIAVAAVIAACGRFGEGDSAPSAVDAGGTTAVADADTSDPFASGDEDSGPPIIAPPDEDAGARRRFRRLQATVMTT